MWCDRPAHKSSLARCHGAHARGTSNHGAAELRELQELMQPSRGGE